MSSSRASSTDNNYTPPITSFALSVEDAKDALEVLWLVQCGLLPLLHRPLTEEQGKSLGHGSVLVWIDKLPDSLSNKLLDGRSWKYPAQRNGLFVYTERVEMPSLYRYHLTARRNVKGKGDDRYWHLVAYKDRHMSSRKLPRIQDDPKFSSSVNAMPPGYFVPEFGTISENPPPPLSHDSIPHISRTILGPEPIISKDLQLPDLAYRSVVDVDNTEILPPAPESRWPSQSTETLSHHPNAPHSIALPSFPVLDPPPEVTHLEVEVQEFETAFMSNPQLSSTIRAAAEHISKHEDFKVQLEVMSHWTRVTQQFGPTETQDAIVRQLNALLDCLSRLGRKFNPQLEARYTIQRVPEGEGPSIVAFEGAVQEWPDAAIFLSARPWPLNYGRDVVAATLPRPKNPVEGYSDSRTSAQPGTASEDSVGVNAFTPLSRAKVTGPNAEIMLNHAIELMANFGTRRHVIGIDVEGFDARFWYFDRAGSIHSTPVNIRADPARFIGLMLALQCSASTLWGSEASLIPQQESDSSFGDVKGHQIYLGQHRFELIRPIHVTWSLFGRSTAVYEARYASRQDKTQDVLSIPESVMVKFAWQLVDQTSDDELFRLVEQRGIQGVARLHLSTGLVRLSHSLRGQLCPPGAYRDRELRVQVMGPLCVPLYTLTDLATFKEAFRSLVKAHHDLHTHAGIVHRDISINNLMVEAARPTVGVLIDLDLAAQNREYGANVPIQARRIGTVPFLATEFLNPALPFQHLYRHDLESFVFVLAWILSNYADGEAIETDEFRRWYQGPLEQMAAAKRDFLLASNQMKTAQFPVLQATWLTPLARQIMLGYSAQKDSNGDDETLGGHVTYDAINSVLQS